MLNRFATVMALTSGNSLNPKGIWKESTHFAKVRDGNEPSAGI